MHIFTRPWSVAHASLAYTALALVSSSTALAQTPEPELEEVVVTGTRLLQVESPASIRSLSIETIEQKAPSSILEVLYQIPSFRQDSGPSQSQRTGGSSNVQAAVLNLRGLNSGFATRTLTLINGQRQVGDSFANVDTNRIPVSLIERVDVLTGGASAAYGSDAVAGVVNFILNDKLEGFRGSAQYNISERGDNKQTTLTMGFGTGFAGDRGHIIFGADYSDNKGVGTMYSRNWGRQEPGVLTPSATQRGNGPATVLSNGVEYASFLPGGLIQGVFQPGAPTATPNSPLMGTAFDANGNPYAFPFGTRYGNFAATGNGIVLQQGATSNYLNTPLGTIRLANASTRKTGLARVTFDITPEFSVFSDVSYLKVNSDSQNGVSNAPNAVVSTLKINDSNPYIQQLPQSIRGQIPSGGSIAIGLLPTQINPTGSGNSAYVYSNSGQIYQVDFGVRGKVFNDWDWDLSYANGKQQADNQNLDSLNAINFAAATYVVSGPNGPVCGPSATNPNFPGTAGAALAAKVLPGCVPFNVFGTNSASPAAIAYVTAHTHGRIVTTQKTISANLRGSPFDNWAGPVSLATGFEHRTESLSNRNLDGYDATALTFGGNTDFGGKRDVNEGYLEVGMPLLKDVVAVKSLDLNVAARRTRYQYSGDVTTWKAGLVWQMNNAVQVHAMRSRDIRAPNLTELFRLGAPVSAGANLINPFGSAGTISALSVTTGSLTIKPENADTFTGGIVFTPTWDWSQGISLSIDYFKIKISDVIAAVAPVDIVTRCRDNSTGLVPNFNDPYCASIDFNTSVVAGGRTAYDVRLVRAAFFNQNLLATQGVDVTLNYQLPERALHIPGRFTLHALGSYQPHLTTTVGAVSTNNAQSSAGVPSEHWNFGIDYALSRAHVQLVGNYTNKMYADKTRIGPDDPRYASVVATASNTINKNLFPSATYWDLGAQYDLLNREGKAKIQLYGNITNLFDKQPPDLSFAGLAGLGLGASFPYDLIGRQYKLGMRASF